MKKVFISGCSRGIGKSIKENLLFSYKIIGGSRSQGFDIVKNYDEVLKTILECDVFVNNANGVHYMLTINCVIVTAQV